jgi:hypothetical protein
MNLDEISCSLLLIFCPLLGISFGGISLDIFSPIGFSNNLFCFSAGFIFGNLVSFKLVKLIS